MARIALIGTVTALMALQAVWALGVQSGRQPPAMRSEAIGGGLHMLSGEGGNVAVYATDEGVLIVDDMFYRNHAAVMAAVKNISDRPLRYVVNTHQHDDHAGGNALMLPIAEVIAHRNVRINLVEKRQPFFEDTPGTPIGLPRITFSQEASIFLGGKEVRAIHFGRGHTNGDAIVYFPDVRAVHTGDLFLVPRAAPGRAGGSARAGRPAGVPIFVDYAQGGSFIEWSRTLDGLLTLEFDTIIPGHGPVATRADLVRFRADLEAMRTRIAGFIREGRSRDEVVRMLEADYGWRATGCPPSPPTPGCLQYQQVDALIAELREVR